MRTLFAFLWLLQASPVLLENDYVRVSRNAAACDTGCGDRIIVALGPMNVASRRLARGEIAVVGSGQPRPNISGGDYLEVAIKPNHPPVKSPPVRIAPDKNTLLHDSPAFFVFEEKLEPGDTRARHSHSQRVVIVLNETRLQQWPDGGAPVFRNQVPNDVHFNEPVTHVVKTAGEKALRNIVIEFKPAAAAALDRKALAAQVRSEFLHAWNAYKRYAWGHDELMPLSRKHRDWYAEPLYMTAVDSLDALLMMGLQDEAEKTKAFLIENLSFDKDISVKNFEITIRVLGGLLSAYQMTGDRRLLAKAEDLGTRLLPVFDSTTGMPYVNVNLRTGKTSGARTNPAEVGTLILEFGTLARLTGKPAFYDKPKKALVALYERRSKTTGLVGQGINVETGEWTSTSSHIGGAIDSYYEYLLKCEKLFGDSDCGRMWRDSLPAIHKYLADETAGGLWYGAADMNTGKRTRTIYGSLHAFMPSILAMGGEVDRARRLQDSSYRMWMLHGIEPELLDYSTMRVVAAGYELRPEIIESTYYLFHYTQDPKYLDMGRTFFNDLMKHCRTEDGYTVLKSVVTKEKGDLMHSFLLAETLKYLYLLFAPGAVDFDKVVFNTEAHPLRRTW